MYVGSVHGKKRTRSFFNAEALGRDGTAGARRGGKGVLLVHYGGYVDISTLRRIRIYLIRILRRTWTRLAWSCMDEPLVSDKITGVDDRQFTSTTTTKIPKLKLLVLTQFSSKYNNSKSDLP